MKPKRQVALGLHAGTAFNSFADHYPTIADAGAEAVQNALDASATRIRWTIDLKRGRLTIEDNGTGMTPEQFSQSFAIIGRSVKDQKKMGQFGLGAIAFINKAKQLSYTSCAERQGVYHRWTFPCEEVLASHELMSIPEEEVTELRYGVRNPGNYGGKRNVTWRTQVKAEGLSNQRFHLGKLTVQDLKESLLGKYAEAIRVLGTEIELVVIDKNGKEQSETFTASPFKGTPLGPYRMKHPESGRITLIELYLADDPHPPKKGGRQGPIAFLERAGSSTLTVEQFLACTRGIIEDKVATALKSWAFLGKITSEGFELHQDRDHFLATDELERSCAMIAQCFHEHFEEIYDSIQEERSRELEESSARQAIAILEPLVREHISVLADLISSGLIDTNDDEQERRIDIGTQPPQGSDRRNETGTKAERAKPLKHASQDPEPKRGDGKEANVKSPMGKPRKPIRGKSQLGITHEPIRGSDPFEFRVERGLIVINNRHPGWLQCRSMPGDRTAVEYTVRVLIYALTQLDRDPKDTVRDMELFDKLIRMDVTAIVNSGKIRTALASAAKAVSVGA